MPATVKKRARPVRDILRESGAPPVIDYWSLDTEGSELSILASFPFDEYSFRVLTVEHNRLPIRHQLHALLGSNGYVRVATLVIDDCYVKPELIPPTGQSRSGWRSAAFRAGRPSGV